MRNAQAGYIARRLHSLGLTGKLAIDIDDTLSRTTKMFVEVLSEHFPPPRKITVAEAQRHYALHGSPIYWGGLPEAKGLRRSLAHDSGAHADLDVFPRAVAGMRELYEEGLIGCYFTARSEDMRAVTEDWLHKNGFPDAPIFMRDGSVDFKYHFGWKAEVLHDLTPDVCGAVDNSAILARQVEELRYKGMFFLFGLTEEDYQSTTGRVVTSPDWDITVPTVLEHRESFPN